MIDRGIRKSLPKAPLFSAEWSTRTWYFAKFRLANAVRLQLGYLTIHFRAPWLEYAARTNYPHLFS